MHPHRLGGGALLTTRRPTSPILSFPLTSSLILHHPHTLSHPLLSTLPPSIHRFQARFSSAERYINATGGSDPTSGVPLMRFPYESLPKSPPPPPLSPHSPPQSSPPSSLPLFSPLASFFDSVLSSLQSLSSLPRVSALLSSNLLSSLSLPKLLSPLVRFPWKPMLSSLSPLLRSFNPKYGRFVKLYSGTQLFLQLFPLCFNVKVLMLKF